MASDPLVDALERYRAAAQGIDTAKARAAQQIQAARDRAEAARSALHAAIVTQALHGRRQRDLVAITGYSRERIRQVLRAGGVEPE